MKGQHQDEECERKQKQGGWHGQSSVAGERDRRASSVAAAYCGKRTLRARREQGVLTDLRLLRKLGRLRKAGGEGLARELALSGRVDRRRVFDALSI